MKRIRLMLQFGVQGYVTVDLPEKEDGDRLPEVVFNPQEARGTHMIVSAADTAFDKDVPFAGQLALNTLAVHYAKAVAQETEKTLAARDAGPETPTSFPQPKGQA